MQVVEAAVVVGLLEDKAGPGETRVVLAVLVRRLAVGLAAQEAAEEVEEVM